MRHFLILISLIVLSTRLIAQNDTAYTAVPLLNLNYSKTLIVEVGAKAKIYLPVDSITKEAKQYLTNDFVKGDYSRIIAFFDSASKHRDTVLIGFYQRLPLLEHLISQQLQNGHAKVFYKRQKTFVDTILHRRERFGGHRDRFFYLADHRPFFGVVEATGLINNKALLSGQYYGDYVKEGEKLASLRTE